MTPPPTPLRILLTIKTNEGGLWILPHIDELRRRGHDVMVLLPPGPGRLRTSLAQRAVPVVESPFDFRFRPRLSTALGLLRLRRVLRTLSPDVLHYHLYASALATRLASLRLDIPRVHMVAGPLYLESPPVRLAERVLARLDTVTIGGSRFTSRKYRELGLPADRAPSIPYGFDAQRFQPLGPDVRDRTRDALGVEPDTFLVVMVALVYAPKRAVHRGRGIKGHDVLLSAWASFHAEHPRSRLVLIGSGFDDAGEAHREELIRRFRISGSSSITWLPTTDDVRPCYAAADLSVSPSLSENHGAAVEAGAMGVPSIVSDAGALPETVTTTSGWVFPRGDHDALAESLRGAYAEFRRGALPERGMRARRFVLEHFSGIRAAQDVADTLERAAQQPPHGPRTLSLFTDARFLGTDHGWQPVDPANGSTAREAYLRDGNRMRIVARGEALPGRSAGALDDGSELAPLPYYVGPRSLARRLVPLARAVAREVARAEVIVLRQPGIVGSVAAPVCRLLRRRYAVEVVGDPADVLRSGVLGDLGRRLADPAAAYLRWVVRGASASRFVTRSALQDRYPPRKRTPTLSMPNVRLGPGALAECARDWAPEPGHLVAIGSHETRYKGHDVLLGAMRILADEGVKVTATIVGDGRLHDDLVDLARRLDLAGSVTFTGTIGDRSVLLDLLDSASLFVMPSRTEGLPRALVEAMARALPAVGTNVGGIPELLDESCLVPPEDPAGLARAIARLLRDDREWEAQSRRNLALARGYGEGELDRLLAGWIRRVPPARRRPCR